MGADTELGVMASGGFPRPHGWSSCMAEETRGPSWRFSPVRTNPRWREATDTCSGLGSFSRPQHGTQNSD